MEQERNQSKLTDDAPVCTSYMELAELVRSISKVAQENGIAKLKLEHGDLRLTISTHSPAISRGTGENHVQSTPTDGQHDVAEQQVPGQHTISAPMIGTFYEASAPGEDPFIQLGDEISEGQTIGIVEAMKIMNEIAADRAGIVVEIVADNGATVEYGSPLIIIQTEK